MTTFDATTIILLSGIAVNAIISLYVISMILRPLLTTAVTGLVDLARQAIGACGIQVDAVSTSADKTPQ